MRTICATRSHSVLVADLRELMWRLYTDLEWLLTIDKHNAAALKEKAVVLQRFTSCLD